jgi:hypothetical protein
MTSGRPAIIFAQPPSDRQPDGFYARTSPKRPHVSDRAPDRLRDASKRIGHPTDLYPNR